MSKLLQFLFITSIVHLPVFSEVNLLNGKCNNSIIFSNEVVFTYDGVKASDVYRPNEQKNPDFTMGLGWSFGTPYIEVYHSGTVDIADDRFFYSDGKGGKSEIIRCMENKNNSSELIESYYSLGDPLAYVRITDNSPDENSARIITMWEIIKTDGTIYRFGLVNNELDGLRSMPYWNNTISKGSPNNETPGIFYYRWDLKEIETPEHLKTTFYYQPIIRITTTGFTYTGQSLLKKIRNPIGDTTTFEYDLMYPDATPTYEGPLQPCNEDFNMSNTYLLRYVYKYTSSNRVESHFRNGS